MFYKNRITTYTMVLIILAAAALPAAAQNNTDVKVSDKELVRYAEVVLEIQQIQSEYGKEAQSAISDSSLSEERFDEIYQAAQEGSEGAEKQTEKETEEFNKILGKMQNLQQKANEKMVTLVKDNGFTVDRFNEITRAYRSSTELQERLQELL